MSSAIFPLPAHMVLMMCVLHGTLQQNLSSSIVALRRLMSADIGHLPIDKNPEPAVNKSHSTKQHHENFIRSERGDRKWQKKSTTGSTTCAFTTALRVLKKFRKNLISIVIMKNTSDASGGFSPWKQERNKTYDNNEIHNKQAEPPEAVPPCFIPVVYQSLEKGQNWLFANILR